MSSYNELRRRQHYLRRRAKRLRGIALLGGKCAVCGFDAYPSALDVHHVEPGKKTHRKTQIWTWTWEKIVEELRHCVLVCANCHAGVHTGDVPEPLRIPLVEPPGPPPQPGPARGEAVWNAKLTEGDVREIRRLRATGLTCASIAERFDVVRETVSQILNGKTWVHVLLTEED